MADKKKAAAKRNASTDGLGFTQRDQQELTHCKAIAAVAQKPEYAPLLAEREIDSDLIAGLLTDAEHARVLATNTRSARADKRNATRVEAEAKRALIEAIQEVQSAAKQKYPAGDPKRKRFLVGQRFGARARLEQASHAVLTLIDTEALPGITAARKQRLAQLRQAYIDSNRTQGDHQTEAMAQRRSARALLRSISDRRRAIQHAADAQWPYRDRANALIRREFGLPARSPFKG